MDCLSTFRRMSSSLKTKIQSPGSLSLLPKTAVTTASSNLGSPWTYRQPTQTRACNTQAARLIKVWPRKRRRKLWIAVTIQTSLHLPSLKKRLRCHVDSMKAWPSRQEENSSSSITSNQERKESWKSGCSKRKLVSGMNSERICMDTHSWFGTVLASSEQTIWS